MGQIKIKNAEIEYEVKGESVIITSVKGAEDHFNVPAEIEGYPVTAIRDDAFKYNKTLISVTIPAGIVEIGKCAFSYCDSLKSIEVEEDNPSYKSVSGLLFTKDGKTLVKVPRGYYLDDIPSGVKEIGDYAFCGCETLKFIVIPYGVTKIGKYAFCGCKRLCVILIPKSVTSIGKRAFGACEKLNRIEMQDSEMEIAMQAFYGCGMTSIRIPKGLKIISFGLLSGCEKLTSVKIPDSVTTIQAKAFKSCQSLENITIPDSVTAIEELAFEHCENLTNVTLPKNLNTIGDWAFISCPKLNNVIIPDSVTKIGIDAFSYCKELSNVSAPRHFQWFDEFKECSPDLKFTFRDE